MTKSIGILYICTGPYVLFWKDFYESFEKNFLPSYEKKYYVFTDAEEIFAENNLNVKKLGLSQCLGRLLRFLDFQHF